MTGPHYTPATFSRPATSLSGKRTPWALVVCLVSCPLETAPGTGCSRNTSTASWRQGGTHHRRRQVHIKSAQHHHLLFGIKAKPSLCGRVIHVLHSGFFSNTRVGGCCKLIQSHPVYMGPRVRRGIRRWSFDHEEIVQMSPPCRAHRL
jgi:hypothetical protein